MGENSQDDCLPLSFPQELRSHKALIVKLLADSLDPTTGMILRALDVYDEVIAYLAESCSCEQDVYGSAAIRICLALKNGYGFVTVDDDPLQLGLFDLWRLVREVRDARRYITDFPGFTSPN